MKAERITWKSSLPKYELGKGIEYRVMFIDIFKYLKKQWLEYADGICFGNELNNPSIEMNAILNEDDSLDNVYFQYYFDDYEYFDVKEKDIKLLSKLFIEFVKNHGENLPDAYDYKTYELMGEVDWEILAYANE